MAEIRRSGRCAFPGCIAECPPSNLCTGCGKHTCELHDTNPHCGGAGHDPSDHWTIRALYCEANVDAKGNLPCEEPLGFVRFLPDDGRDVGCAEFVCPMGHVLHVELPGEAAR
jgi:hypothetical protein